MPESPARVTGSAWSRTTSPFSSWTVAIVEKPTMYGAIRPWLFHPR
jgi:hypothetical protein